MYEVERFPKAGLHWQLVSWSKPAEHSYNPYTIYAKDLQVNTPPVYANLDDGLLSDQPKRWSGSVSVEIWDELSYFDLELVQKVPHIFKIITQ